MRKIIPSVFLPLWIFFSSSLLFSQNASEIRGRCVDETGKPLEGAEVFLYYNSFPSEMGTAPPELECGVKGKTLTDARGEFQLPADLLTYQPCLAGRDKRTGYCLIAKHTDRAIGIVPLKQGNETLRQTLTLVRGRSLKASVADETTREKIPGVRVRFVTASGFNFALNDNSPAACGITDKNGECILTNLPVTECFFIADTEGYVPVWKEIMKGTEGTSTELVMSRGIAISGKASFPDGKPAAGLLVRFSKEGYWSGMASYAVTDSSGIWKKVCLPVSFRDHFAPSNQNDDRNQPVTVNADQFLEEPPFVSSSPVLLDTREKREFNVELKVERVSSEKLFVKFIASDLTPLVGNKAAVYLSDEKTGRWDDIGFLCSDGEGIASISVPRGQVMLMQEQDVVIPGWYIPEDYSILALNWSGEKWRYGTESGFSRETLYRHESGSGTEKDPVVIKVGVIPALPLKGFVVDIEGRPMKNCQVFSGFAREGAKTNEEGMFAFPVMPSDIIVELFVTAPDRKFAGFGSADPKSSEPVKITVQPTREYPARVVDCEGMPVGKIRMYSEIKLNDKTNKYQIRQTITADDEGRFVLKKALPGTACYFWWSEDNEINRDFDSGSSEVKLSGITEENPLTITVKRYIESIMGKVTDIKGKPVEDAAVEILNWDIIPRNIQYNQKPIHTNEKGEFTAGRLAKGKTGIRITHKDYKSVLLSGISTDCIDVSAVLKPKGPVNVTATVKNAEGVPIPGINLSVLEVPSLYAGAGEDIKTIKLERKTGRKGTCSFIIPEQKEKQKNQWTLLCGAPGYYSFFCGLYENTDMELEITLKKRQESSNLSGMVVDTENRPVKGANVRIASILSTAQNQAIRRGARLPEGILTAVTDKEGRFDFPAISKEDMATLEAEAEGYARQIFHYSKRANAEEKICFRLPPSCEISGSVLYEDQKPAAGIFVSASGRTTSIHTVRKTDEKGFYSFNNLPAGTYYINARLVPSGLPVPGEEPPEWVASPAAYSLIATTAGNPATGKDFVLRKGIVVSGKVIENISGKPLADIHVGYVEGVPPGVLYYASAKTDAQGRYKIRVLPGKGYFQLYKPGDNTPQTKEMSFEEGEVYNNVDLRVE